MKKLFSIVLAVAMMTVMVCSMFGVQASALEKVSLLPANASDFTCKDGGDGSVTVTKEGEVFKFTANAGWPQAFYMGADQNAWAKAYVNQECYLNWDFEVKTGAANVLVFFCGQNPADQATLGTAETINYFIDPANNRESSGQVKDLPVGKYKGSIHVKDLGCREDLLVGEGTEQYFTVSGIKVFAVGGEVVVNELSVGPKAGDAVTTAPAGNNTTAAANNTTAAANNTTAAANGTTTVPQTTAVTPNGVKTADISDAMLFVVVAIVAGGVVTLSAVASKKSGAR